jgi:hypothetical protein
METKMYDVSGYVLRLAFARKLYLFVQDQSPDTRFLFVTFYSMSITFSSVFLEAIRQFMYRVKREDVCLVHVSLVPVLGSVGEQKTKPTQHGVKELRSAGLSPDIIVCRSSLALESGTKEKLAMFCQASRTKLCFLHVDLFNSNDF